MLFLLHMEHLDLLLDDGLLVVEVVEQIMVLVVLVELVAVLLDKLLLLEETKEMLLQILAVVLVEHIMVGVLVDLVFLS